MEPSSEDRDRVGKDVGGGSLALTGAKLGMDGVCSLSCCCSCASPKLRRVVCADTVSMAGSVG